MTRIWILPQCNTRIQCQVQLKKSINYCNDNTFIDIGIEAIYACDASSCIPYDRVIAPVHIVVRGVRVQVVQVAPREGRVLV